MVSLQSAVGTCDFPAPLWIMKRSITKVVTYYAKFGDCMLDDFCVQDSQKLPPMPPAEVGPARVRGSDDSQPVKNLPLL